MAYSIDTSLAHGAPDASGTPPSTAQTVPAVPAESAGHAVCVTVVCRSAAGLLADRPSGASRVCKKTLRKYSYAESELRHCEYSVDASQRRGAEQHIVPQTLAMVHSGRREQHPSLSKGTESVRPQSGKTSSRVLREYCCFRPTCTVVATCTVVVGRDGGSECTARVYEPLVVSGQAATHRPPSEYWLPLNAPWSMSVGSTP